MKTVTIIAGLFLFTCVSCNIDAPKEVKITNADSIVVDPTLKDSIKKIDTTKVTSVVIDSLKKK